VCAVAPPPHRLPDVLDGGWEGVGKEKGFGDELNGEESVWGEERTVTFGIGLVIACVGVRGSGRYMGPSD
jgi:hypothetical protein